MLYEGIDPVIAATYTSNQTNFLFGFKLNTLPTLQNYRKNVNSFKGFCFRNFIFSILETNIAVCV